MIKSLLFNGVKTVEKGFVETHQELRVYQLAFEAAILIFELSRRFPEEERLLLTESILRSSRSVCIKIAAAWGKRRYQKAFIAKLNEAEAEAAVTQSWVEFAVMCGYLHGEAGQGLFGQYREILMGLARLIENSSAWVVGRRR